MALSFLYLMARWLVGMLLGRLRSEHARPEVSRFGLGLMR